MAAPQQDEAKADLSSVETSAVGRHQVVCKVRRLGHWAEPATEPKLCQSVSQEAVIAVSKCTILRVRMGVCRHVNRQAKLCPGSEGPVDLFILLPMKC